MIVLLHGLGTQAVANRPGTDVEPALAAIEASLDQSGLASDELGPVLLAIGAMNLAMGRPEQGFAALGHATQHISDPPPQWALTAWTLHLVPDSITDPVGAAAEVDRLEAEVVPQLPSPAYGAVVIADARSMALARLRRYEELARHNAAALEDALDAGLPAEGHLFWALTASGLIAGHLAGRHDHADLFLETLRHRLEPSLTATWYPYVARIGEALHAADTIGVDEGCIVLARAARQDERTRIAAGTSAYLAAFARLAHLGGDDQRALEYLEHTSILFPITGAVAIETLAEIHEWPAAERQQRSTDAHLEGLGPERAERAREHVPALLRAEVDRWS